MGTADPARNRPARLARGAARLLGPMLLAAGLLAGAGAPVAAQSRCKVADPTGTPLNVRSGPYGDVLGQVKNGTLVRIEADAVDGKGKPWVYVVSMDDGRPLGWVFRNYVTCS